ncbi:hypothetical protein [Desulfospira joergensenii]|uniref:hypothetical protein n=1 Tax=Desulfospira joergensenii TaxID=53329 RepID=UPI0003B5C2E7|nr:hypothetical protein [Desulfospira joergensenii]
MDNRKKYENKLKDWLNKWEKKIAELSNQADQQDLSRSKLDEIKILHQGLNTKFNELRQSENKEEWIDMKSRVEELVGHIDESFRQSLAYFH